MAFHMTASGLDVGPKPFRIHSAKLSSNPREGRENKDNYLKRVNVRGEAFFSFYINNRKYE